MGFRRLASWDIHQKECLHACLHNVVQVDIHWSTVFFSGGAGIVKDIDWVLPCQSLAAVFRGFSTAPVNYRLDTKRNYVSSRVG